MQRKKLRRRKSRAAQSKEISYHPKTRQLRLWAGRHTLYKRPREGTGIYNIPAVLIGGGIIIK